MRPRFRLWAGLVIMTLVTSCKLFVLSAFPDLPGSPSWKFVGTQGFGVTNVAYTGIAIERATGTVYVTFEDGAYGARATVMSFTGGDWSYVGVPGFSANTTQFNCIALDSTGTPYAAFMDVSTGRADVMKYSSTLGWQSVGAPDFSANTVISMSFSIGANNVPYVAFTDSTGQVVVESFNGSAWSVVGAPFGTNTSNVSLALDNGNNPWVGFSDGSQGGNATVMSFDGAAWNVVGSAGAASTGAAYGISLALDPGNRPYLACSDASYSGLAVVTTFESGAWRAAGGAGFSAGVPYSASLVTSIVGVPLVAYADGGGGAGGPAMLMTLAGGSWGAVGSQGFAPGNVQDTSLALDRAGRLYVAFVDLGAGGKPSVMAYR